MRVFLPGENFPETRGVPRIHHGQRVAVTAHSPEITLVVGLILVLHVLSPLLFLRVERGSQLQRAGTPGGPCRIELFYQLRHALLISGQGLALRLEVHKATPPGAILIAGQTNTHLGDIRSLRQLTEIILLFQGFLVGLHRVRAADNHNGTRIVKHPTAAL